MAGRQLPDFGPDNSANQPLQFDFPKREFGKTKIVKRALSEASLPRKRKTPRCLEVGSGESFHHSTAKEFYFQQYFECLDFVTNAIKDRFNQPGYKML